MNVDPKIAAYFKQVNLLVTAKWYQDFRGQGIDFPGLIFSKAMNNTISDYILTDIPVEDGANLIYATLRRKTLLFLEAKVSKK